MNALVIYYSKFGNTKRVAEAIADYEGEIDRARAWAEEILDRYGRLSKQ